MVSRETIHGFALERMDAGSMSTRRSSTMTRLYNDPSHFADEAAGA